MEWKIAEKLAGARGGLLEPGPESFMINTAYHNFDINTTSIFHIHTQLVENTSTFYILTDPIKAPITIIKIPM